VTPLVIDASVAVKWVIEERGTPAALALRDRFKLIAPELLVAECADILWKKVTRNELSDAEALLCARLLENAGIEIMPTGALLEAATKIAIELAHPAYDCMYLALAVQQHCRFVTADNTLVRKAKSGRWKEMLSALATEAPTD